MLTSATLVCRPCTFCDEPAARLTLPYDLAVAVNRWRTGADPRPVQAIAPNLTSAQREMLLTGTHPRCWDRMFDSDVSESEDAEQIAARSERADILREFIAEANEAYATVRADRDSDPERVGEVLDRLTAMIVDAEAELAGLL